MSLYPCHVAQAMPGPPPAALRDLRRGRITKMTSSQTLRSGREADRIEAALKQLADAKALSRLWDHDASLWSQDPATQDVIRHRLGWLGIPQVMTQQIPALRECAQEVLKAGFTHALLLGMGGSSLFAEVCRNTFGVAPGHPDLTVLDTTDPSAIRSSQQRRPPERLCMIVSSKSGTTSEVLALSKYFYEIFQTSTGHPGSHCLAITDAGTPLEAQAKTWNVRHTFVHGLASGMDVGGRFSALTYFGLVPAALLGVDLETLLARATAMLETCGPGEAQAENPAVQLAAVLASLAQRGRDKVTLLASPVLESFGTWVEQLLAESLGKSGKGLVPIFGEPLRDVGRYRQDRVFIELQLASQPDAAIERQVQALEDAGFPLVRIRWQDSYDLGGEVVKWEVAIALIGHLLGVNPFDEPNVQESKDRTKALLLEYIQTGRFAQEQPFLSEDGIELFGTPPSGSAKTLPQMLAGFLTQRVLNDYCALLSFLPRTAGLDEAVRVMRERLGNALGMATTLGFGPRYLHSTGQLYKGGADAGLFLLLTADEEQDLEVPGESYTFGVLKQAQALGDFQAMGQRKRRMLRIHLGHNPEQSIAKLLSAVGEAAAACALQ